MRPGRFWVLALIAGACSSGRRDQVGVSLITKNSVNPFFVAMQKGAREQASRLGVDLTIAAGKRDGDEEGQIQAIEIAVARGERGILITPNGPGVYVALRRAREAGLYVIALDTPTDPPEVVDITFATDNFEAGRLIGRWALAQVGGGPARIALLDLFADKVVSVDYERDQGFLSGMGIPTADPRRNGDEPRTGVHAGGGPYTIVCNEPTLGAEDGGRTAMERCLARSPEINVVYTINEPSALGAHKALQAAGREGVLVVSVDGGCDGVGLVKQGILGATAQQYPVRMAALGVEAIVRIEKQGERPRASEGRAFFDTGVALVTDTPVSGLESLDSSQGLALCWG
jgi:fructose transport system substrate-binding protein